LLDQSSQGEGLLKGKLDYYVIVMMIEKIFVEKFMRPFKDHVTGLTDDYASKCLGEATVE
jgi:mTERF domain-containing protein